MKADGCVRLPRSFSEMQMLLIDTVVVICGDESDRKSTRLNSSHT